MNVLKNMEAIFLAAAVLVGVTGAAQAASIARHVRYDAQVTIDGRRESDREAPAGRREGSRLTRSPAGMFAGPQDRKTARP